MQDSLTPEIWRKCLDEITWDGENFGNTDYPSGEGAVENELPEDRYVAECPFCKVGKDLGRIEKPGILVSFTKRAMFPPVATMGENYMIEFMLSRGTESVPVYICAFGKSPDECVFLREYAAIHAAV